VWNGRSFARGKYFKIGRQVIEAIIERILYFQNQKVAEQIKSKGDMVFRIYGIVEISHFLTDVLPKHLCSSSDTSLDLSMR
jgi:hypothetical protein